MVKSYFIEGKALYAKILGIAPPGYDNGPAEWTFDLVLDEKGIEDYLKSGADKFYIRTNKDSGVQYVRFSRKALKKDGSAAQSISVIGSDGAPWDQKTLIGNDSILRVKFALNEIEHKKVKRLKPSVLAVQVWEHKKYESSGGFKIKAPEAVQEDWASEVA